MNIDQIEGNWKQVKGLMRSNWAELTDDDVEHAKGDRAQLEGKIQERYGKTKEQARKEVDDFIASL